MSSLSKLDDLLGERWYIRGLNSAGDFCYIEPGASIFHECSSCGTPYLVVVQKVAK